MSWVDVTTAVGTAAAAVVALGLGLRAEWRATRLDREQHEHEERRQAVHVAAWMLVEQDDGDGPQEVDAYDPSLSMSKARVYSVIQNASDEPIWDVVIHAPIVVEKTKGSEQLTFEQSEDEIISVGPHETLRLEITVMTIPYNRQPLHIEFRDNADRDWRRDDRGRLHPGRVSASSWAWFDEEVKRRDAPSNLSSSEVRTRSLPFRARRGTGNVHRAG